MDHDGGFEEFRSVGFGPQAILMSGGGAGAGAAGGLVGSTPDYLYMAGPGADVYARISAAAAEVALVSLPDPPLLRAARQRLQALRSAYAAAELGLPVAQVLHSAHRSAVLALRQDLAQLRQLLGTAVKEVSACEYDVAGVRGGSFGSEETSPLVIPRAPLCEDMPVATLSAYARQASSLKQAVESAADADAAVGLSGVESHLSQHAPLAARAAEEATAQLKAELRRQLAELQMQYKTLEAECEGKRGDAEAAERARSETHASFLGMKNSVDEARASTETELANAAAALAKAEGLVLLQFGHSSSGPRGAHEVTVEELCSASSPGEDSPTDKERRLRRLIEEATAAERARIEEEYAQKLAAQFEANAAALEEASARGAADVESSKVLPPLPTTPAPSSSPVRGTSPSPSRGRAAASGAAAMPSSASAMGAAEVEAILAAVADPSLLPRLHPVLVDKAAQAQAERQHVEAAAAEESSKAEEIQAALQRIGQDLLVVKGGISVARGLYELKVTVRRMWALRGVRPAAVNPFLADTLRAAPYSSALAARLREAFRAVRAGYLPTCTPLDVQLWSEGMVVTAGSVVPQAVAAGELVQAEDGPLTVPGTAAAAAAAHDSAPRGRSRSPSGASSRRAPGVSVAALLGRPASRQAAAAPAAPAGEGAAAGGHEEGSRSEALEAAAAAGAEAEEAEEAEAAARAEMERDSYTAAAAERAAQAMERQEAADRKAARYAEIFRQAAAGPEAAAAEAAAAASVRVGRGRQPHHPQHSVEGAAGAGGSSSRPASRSASATRRRQQQEAEGGAEAAANGAAGGALLAHTAGREDLEPVDPAEMPPHVAVAAQKGAQAQQLQAAAQPRRRAEDEEESEDEGLRSLLQRIRESASTGGGGAGSSLSAPSPAPTAQVQGLASLGDIRQAITATAPSRKASGAALQPVQQQQHAVGGVGQGLAQRARERAHLEAAAAAAAATAHAREHFYAALGGSSQPPPASSTVRAVSPITMPTGSSMGTSGGAGGGTNMAALAAMLTAAAEQPEDSEEQHQQQVPTPSRSALLAQAQPYMGYIRAAALPPVMEVPHSGAPTPAASTQRGGQGGHGAQAEEAGFFAHPHQPHQPTTSEFTHSSQGGGVSAVAPQHQGQVAGGGSSKGAGVQSRDLYGAVATRPVAFHSASVGAPAPSGHPPGAGAGAEAFSLSDAVRAVDEHGPAQGEASQADKAARYRFLDLGEQPGGGHMTRWDPRSGAPMPPPPASLYPTLDSSSVPPTASPQQLQSMARGLVAAVGSSVLQQALQGELEASGVSGAPQQESDRKGAEQKQAQSSYQPQQYKYSGLHPMPSEPPMPLPVFGGPSPAPGQPRPASALPSQGGSPKAPQTFGALPHVNQHSSSHSGGGIPQDVLQSADPVTREALLQFLQGQIAAIQGASLPPSGGGAGVLQASLQASGGLVAGDGSGMGEEGGSYYYGASAPGTPQRATPLAPLHSVLSSAPPALPPIQAGPGQQHRASYAASPSQQQQQQPQPGLILRQPVQQGAPLPAAARGGPLVLGTGETSRFPRSSPRFQYGSSALGRALSRDAYQGYDKGAAYQRRMPGSGAASAVSGYTSGSAGSGLGGLGQPRAGYMAAAPTAASQYFARR